MSSIGITIYGYQSKHILDSLKSLCENSSGENNLIINVIDQNNVERSRRIDSPPRHIKIVYDFVKWDSIVSPVALKDKSFKSLSTDYYLELGDGVFLDKNWDTDLIYMLEDNTVLSGNKLVTISAKNLFSIEKTYHVSDSIRSSLMIDRNFIFSKYSTLQKIDRPIFLKYNGEEEYISINLLQNEISLKCLFTTFYSDLSKNISEEQYVPFSLNHGYNIFLNEYREMMNKYYGVLLLDLPFSTDDVMYSIDKSKVDKIGGDRYLNKIKVIN